MWEDEIIEEILQNFITTVAKAGVGTAMEMVGNAGQIAVLERTGEGAFMEAAEATLNEWSDAASVLYDNCPYPEAVEVILEEAGAVMDEVAEAIREMVEAVVEMGEMFF